MVGKMSAETSGKRDGGYIMPESFSFGLEEREDSDENVETGNVSSDSLEDDSVSSCTHRWEALPEDMQTLASESKTIWKCRSCGEMTNTYSWKKP